MTSLLPQTHRKSPSGGLLKVWAFYAKGENEEHSRTTVLVLLERRVRLPVDWNRLTGDGIPFLEARSNHGG